MQAQNFCLEFDWSFTDFFYLYASNFCHRSSWIKEQCISQDWETWHPNLLLFEKQGVQIFILTIFLHPKDTQKVLLAVNTMSKRA